MNDGEVDEGYWAQAAADQAAGRGNDGDEGMSLGQSAFTFY